jgi:hypothetical protein
MQRQLVQKIAKASMQKEGVILAQMQKLECRKEEAKLA